MLSRRSLIARGGTTVLGGLVLAGATTGTAAAYDDSRYAGQRDRSEPGGLTREERRHLALFEDADFNVFNKQRWERLKETHAQNIQVHWPDGHASKGLDALINEFKAVFAWAPNTRIPSHQVRLAQGNLTSVSGVLQGTFSKPMPDGKGGQIPPTGKSFSVNMTTTAIWNSRDLITEAYLYWDNYTFYRQIGLV